MVPGEGVEPSLPRGNWILNPARLPIPPSGHFRLRKPVKLHILLMFCNRIIAFESEFDEANYFSSLFLAIDLTW